MRLANLSLTRQKHQHITARIFLREFIHGFNQRLQNTLRLILFHRTVADFNGIRAAFDLDDRRASEMLRETFRIDRRRGDDDFEVFAFLQK